MATILVRGLKGRRLVSRGYSATPPFLATILVRGLLDGKLPTRGYSRMVRFRVYANDGAGGPVDYATPAAEVGSGSHTTDALAPGAHRFAVRAYDPITGLEEMNADAHADLILDGSHADVTGLPFAPRGLIARGAPASGGSAVVRLDWAYPSRDRRHTPVGFRVYAGTPTVDYGTPVATVAFGTSRHHYTAAVTGLSPATYQFVVRSYNAIGEESNAVIVTLAATTTGPAAVDSLAATATARGS